MGNLCTWRWWRPLIGELLFLAIWVGSVVVAWLGWTGTASETSSAERQLGLSTIIAQLNGVVTGASIILAGIGVFVGITYKRLEEGEARRRLGRAGFWAVAALGVALYDMAMLPSIVTLENPVKVLRVSVLAATALGLVILAGIWFVRCIFAAVEGGGHNLSDPEVKSEERNLSDPETHTSGATSPKGHGTTGAS